jgi:hypothetical protein
MITFKDYLIILEASYPGNIGIMELLQFHKKATPEQKALFKQHVKNEKDEDAWNLVQNVTGVTLHSSVIGK